MKTSKDYRGLLYCNEFFVVLLVLTVFGVWVFFAEYKLYILKNEGEKIMGEITRLDITQKKSLQIEYLYQIGQKKYTGSRFYREKASYDSGEIKDIVRKINEKKVFPVYYDSSQPENSVCFITNENLRLNRALGIAIIVSWGIWGLGYLQSSIWNKK